MAKAKVYWPLYVAAILGIGTILLFITLGISSCTASKTAAEQTTGHGLDTSRHIRVTQAR